jgi:hypothetical protein
MLHRNLDVSEALWNFHRLEDNICITLQQNPQFYLNLPTSSDAFRGNFEVRPIESFGHVKPDETIYVLVDGPNRVFLERKRGTCVFGNVFELKDAMIFKGWGMFLLSCLLSDIFLDIRGVLQIKEKSNEGTPNVWYYEQARARARARLPQHPPQHPFLAGLTMVSKNWPDLIRRTWGSGNFNLYICAIQVPPKSTQGKVRCEESSMLHITDAPILLRSCPPHQQHLKNCGAACCTHISICSTMMYCLKYSITIA